MATTLADHLAIINQALIDKIKVNTIINWQDEKLAGVEKDDYWKDVVSAAVHCCLNGPVGVNKPSTWVFIDDGEMSISDIVDWDDLSNQKWKGACLIVANYLKTNNLVPADCKTVVENGDVWPIKDMKKKTE